MMTGDASLADDFVKLGLAEYIERFIEEGFEDWSSIADITESDMAALGVKLGHRRTLFRQIATLRGHPQTEPLEDAIQTSGDGTAYQSTDEHHRSNSLNGSNSDGLISPSVQNAHSAPQKRRYKRHPKPDDNAPVRPASAYVLFANQMREEQKDSNLNFTQLARLVGDRWKNLEPAAKEAIEAQAGEAKRQYNAEVANYKKSHEYQLYQDYLVEFKERALKDEKPEKLEPPKKSHRLSIREDGENGRAPYPYPSPRPIDQQQQQPLMHGQPPRPFFSIPSVLHEAPDGNHGSSLKRLPPPVGYTPDYINSSSHAPESYSRQSHLPYPLPVKPLHQQDMQHYGESDARLPSIRHEMSKSNGPPRFRG